MGIFRIRLDQQIRDGGFRPVVFLGHGLVVAFFAMTTAVAAAAFWRTRTKILQLPAAGITAYLGAMLILCKSLGSLLYGAVLVPMVRFAKPRAASARGHDIAQPLHFLTRCFELQTLFPPR